jgi:DNA-binding response OmpR family regulator
LTAIEFDLLRTLLEAPGQLLARETLVETVFGRPYHPDDRSLDVHISKLRKKLEPAGWIRAVRGVGYVFTVEDNHVTLTNH